MQFHLLILLILPAVAICQHEGVLDIQFPSIRVLAQAGGNISLQSGVGGNVRLTPGRNGSIYFEDTDLLQILEIVKSLPPIWPEHASSDNLGTFRSGEKFEHQMNAMDPEGSNITYQIVSGTTPPGVILSPSGKLAGTLPETDSIYPFTVRAIDIHGKFSDLTFSITIQANPPCLPEPCLNSGSCEVVAPGGHTCHCVHPYGGTNCQLDCEKNPIGVAANLKKIPDAFMSAHNGFTDYLASNARLLDKRGWLGNDNTSWIQIDLGSLWSIHTVAQQSISATAYVSVFHALVSADGNNFKVYTGNDNSPYALSGTATAKALNTTLPVPATGRFFRFIPVTCSARPFFRLELYGCPVIG